MAKPFKNLVKKMSPAAQARARGKTRKLFQELALKELRESKEITQETLAEILGINQPAISKIEKRGPNVSVQSVEKYIVALGGTLELTAKFPQSGESFPIKIKDEL